MDLKMQYKLQNVQDLMQEFLLLTIMLVHVLLQKMVKLILDVILKMMVFRVFALNALLLKALSEGENDFSYVCSCWCK